MENKTELSKKLATYLTELDNRLLETKHGTPTRADSFYRKGKRDALEQVLSDLTKIIK